MPAQHATTSACVLNPPALAIMDQHSNGKKIFADEKFRSFPSKNFHFRMKFLFRTFCRIKTQEESER